MNRLWAGYVDNRYGSIIRKLRVRLALSRGALWLEVLVRQFWQLWTLLLFSYAFLAFNGLQLFSQNLGRGLVIVVLFVGVGLLGFGLRGVKVPSRDAVIDRLDGKDAPLASLRDQSATGTGDALTRALWEKHQTQMAARAIELRPSPPDLQLAPFDRYGLRLMALVCATVAVFFAPSGGLTSVKNTISLPVFGDNPTASIEAWATPPSYTGRPQVYLGEVADGVVLELPVGTNIVMQVYGGSDDVALIENISDTNEVFSGDKTTVRNAAITVTQSGEVEVLDNDTILDAWRVVATPDNGPNVIVTDEIGQTTSGALRFPFKATDDYGIVAGSAQITLDLEHVDRRFGLTPEPTLREPLTASLPLPFRGATDDISEVLIEDFSKDLWVGMPIIITLSVRDAAGQIGEVQTFGTLPGKRFYIPLAAAFAEQRRDMLWSPDNDMRVLYVLKAMTNMPSDLGLSSGSYLKIRSAIRRYERMLADGVSTDERDEITDTFWDIAVFLEDGDLGDALERLRRAQEKLLQAIEQQADQDEIAKLMEELRDATDEYLEMLSAEAEQNRDSAETAQQLDGNDQLRQMMDELQRLAENGETEAARQLLEEMRQMLENAQIAEQNGGSSEQLDQMQDALGQQQGLSDQTFQQLQEMLENGGEGSPETEGALAERQEALREFLQNLQAQQSESAGEATGEAGDNMENSRDFLGAGELGQALNEQADAIENLRESIRRLSEEQQQTGQGRDGLQEGDTQDQSASEDPLGRPLGRIGTSESGETYVPDQNASERARELLDEIRRRSGDVDRPDAEIEYLKRLLDRF
ncbi:hypothetical protein A9Q96_15745 [Rhodobacterales bacterium 52_120_T64]|nr:hypothetical protein A9Q96_15745 [Rhodobacterales bacterium 52_120_T64]